MKVIWFITLFVFLVAATLVLAAQMGVLKGKKPTDLGLNNGRLKPPSTAPNSVSSQANLYPDHPQRQYAQIAPIQFAGDSQKALQHIAEILQNLPRTEVIIQQPDYLYAQSTTQVMKFTDDIEFWHEAGASVIHVRSASRLGRKDFNVNRERVEKIRAQFMSN